MARVHPVRKYREAAGIGQEAFAKLAKITQPYLSQIETGAKKNLSAAVMRRLIKASGGALTYNQLVNPNARG